MLDARPFSGEIYVHTNVLNGKSYVGQTTAGVSKRWQEHVRHSRLPKRADFRFPFARAIRKYGPEVFESQVLSVAHTKAELDNLEKVWIILLQTRGEKGYNLGAGGEGNPGLKHTAASKEKISKNRTGKALGNRNAAGTIQTLEMRKRKSEANLGRKFSTEHNEKIRIARTGVKRPDVAAWNNARWSATRAARGE
jgi:group I intron endonuclease